MVLTHICTRVRKYRSTHSIYRRCVYARIAMLFFRRPNYGVVSSGSVCFEAAFLPSPASYSHSAKAFKSILLWEKLK